MRFHRTVVFHSPRGRRVPTVVGTLARERGLEILALRRKGDIDALVNQYFPACIIMDGSGGASCIRLCRALKGDPFTAIVPMVLFLDGGDRELVLSGLEAGADEVLTTKMEARELELRLRMALDRAHRDVSVHPTTRLPGTVQIERDMAERLRRGEVFAVCYADLDHFKEFNDRYGYNEGDGVIRLLARILRDVVKGHARTGFIGHIGGDDFIFNVPIEAMRPCCEEIIEVFDELIPYQYDEADRRAGFFLGKDRRGNVLRVPLMTLSIGVVTNQHRTFEHTARISELATEMKSYAKTLSGSVYAVDRRRDPVPVAAGGAQAGPLSQVTQSTGDA
ncbi:MAG TPA: diguanylate cyclase [Longimicrobiales bacterium]